jgi:pantoate kinase
MKASASSPLHITAFFTPHFDLDPLKCGSTGAGFSIINNVTTKVEAEAASNTSKFEIRINGKPREAIVSRRTLQMLTQNIGRSYSVKVDHNIPLPSGCGLGTSGAGALSLALALSKGLKLDLTPIEAARIAHVAEVESRTGLGTVVAELQGGAEMRLVPGAPGAAQVENLPYGDHQVVILILGPSPTRMQLAKQELTDAATRLGPVFLHELRRKPTVEQMMKLSREFVRLLGFVGERAVRILAEAESAGYVVSVALFGETIFALEEPGRATRLREFLSKFETAASTLIVTEISREGAKVLEN